MAGEEGCWLCHFGDEKGWARSCSNPFLAGAKWGDHLSQLWRSKIYFWFLLLTTSSLLFLGRKPAQILLAAVHCTSPLSHTGPSQSQAWSPVADWGSGQRACIQNSSLLVRVTKDLPLRLPQGCPRCVVPCVGHFKSSWCRGISQVVAPGWNTHMLYVPSVVISCKKARDGCGCVSGHIK